MPLEYRGGGAERSISSIPLTSWRRTGGQSNDWASLVQGHGKVSHQVGTVVSGIDSDAPTKHDLGVELGNLLAAHSALRSLLPQQ